MRPRGRHSRMSVMSTYMTRIEPRGTTRLLSALVIPTSSPPITAPQNEPMPPITTTMNAGMTASAPTVGLRLHIGAGLDDRPVRRLLKEPPDERQEHHGQHGHEHPVLRVEEKAQVEGAGDEGRRGDRVPTRR